MRAKPALTAISVMVLLLMAGTSSALLPDFSKEELITNSESIVLATVQGSECAWTSDHSQIYTYVTLHILDQYKGTDLGSELVIQVPGGKVGEIAQVTSDTPQNLQTGNTVILHLFTKETGYSWVYGWEKGSLTVENNTITAYDMTLEQFRQLVEQVER